MSGRIAGPIQPPPRPVEPTVAALSLVLSVGIGLGLAAASRFVPEIGPGVRRPALVAPALLRRALAPAPDEVSRAAFEAERAARLVAEERLAEALRHLRGAESAVFAGETGAWISVPSWGYLPAPVGRRLLLGGGRSAGLRPGAALVALGPDGTPVLLGRLVEVDAGAATALALTDPASAVPVRVGAYGAGGILLQGAFPRPGARLLYVPRTAAVRPGDEVRTVEGVPDLPAGILVGRVDSVEEGEGEFLEIRVALPLEASRLPAVLVAR